MILFNINPLKKMDFCVSDFIQKDPYGYGFSEYEIMQFYKKKFNQFIYRYTKPICIKKNIFYIGVSSSQVAYEMQFKEQEILSVIQNHFKVNKIQKICYQII